MPWWWHSWTRSSSWPSPPNSPSPQEMVPRAAAAAAAAPFNARQNNLVITQTITRQFTTFTTYVTLGAGGSGSTPTDAAGTGAGPTTEPAAPVSTSTPASAGIYGGSGQLSTGQIFGILGGVIGFVVVVLLIWYFLRTERDRGYRADYYSAGSSSDYTGSAVVVEERKRYERRPPRDPWARGSQRRPPPPRGGPAGPRMPPAAYRAAYDVNRMATPDIAWSRVRRNV